MEKFNHDEEEGRGGEFYSPNTDKRYEGELPEHKPKENKALKDKAIRHWLINKLLRNGN